MKNPAPKKPASLDPLTEDVLTRLRASPHADRFVIGGHLALKHYLDFRPTHDVDAWWFRGRDEAALGSLRAVVSAVATAHSLTIAEREWGDVVSLELLRGNQRIFSVQVGTRAVELEPPLTSPWGPLQLESLADNLGSKMNALVNRGAPRDFIDVKKIVDAELSTADECWALWVRKNPGKITGQARQQVLKHLESIELRRPLEQIVDSDELRHTTETRRWFRQAFLAPNSDHAA